MIIEGILITLGFVLAISGLCELIHAIRLLCVAKEKNEPMLSVIFLKSEAAISQLSFAAEQKNWLGDDFAKYVIAVTDAIDGEELLECKRFAKNKGIILCESEQLLRVAENIIE